uniref:Uncharacterized protein n=1 Tax=Anguilla anguilla TaxID=7936 RepID=A0A0E9VUY9_ANGAN
MLNTRYKVRSKGLPSC